MAMTVACPLCSQPGFPDVNSLWLTLIRATTHQLSCPVCQEVLFGLDKLTIHLVSHSLHDQLVQACLSTNLLATPAIVDKSQDEQQSSLAVSQDTMPTANDETKVDAPVASYVLINFPTLENVSIENSGHVPVVPNVAANVIESVKSIPSLCPQDRSFSSLMSPKVPSPDQISFPVLLNSKSNSNASAPNHSLIPQNVASDLCDPLKFITSSPPSYRDDRVVSEISSVVKKQNSPFIPENTVILDESSSPQCSMQTVSESASNAVKINGCNLKTEGLAISCGLCGLSFKDNNIAMLHQQLIHNLNSGDEKRHQLSPKHDDRGHCSKQWLKRGSTASSQSRDASSPLHRFPCHVCNKVFRMRGSLMVHLRVAHAPGGTVGLASRLGGSSPCGKPPIGDVTCKLSMQALSIEEAKASSVEKMCGSGNPFPASSASSHKVYEQTSVNSFGSVSAMSPKLSPTQSSPVQSTSTESFGTMFPCNLCNKTFSKDTLLTQHLKSHESKQWECDVCFKSFTTKYFLKKHKRLHTGEMPYTCAICNKSFTFQQSYHKHLLYHSDEKPHSCSECGRAFKELSTLHNHQRIHTGEKPWACETCGKCFRQRVSYLVHRRIHTGAMPYQCNVCLKSFRYKVSQRTHKCAAQSTGDVPIQSNDLLQQLLQTPGKEMESTIGVQPSISVAFKEPSTFLKEQMQQLNIKQEHQHMNATNILLPADQLGNHFLVGNETNRRLLPSKNCNKSGEQPSQHHLVDSHLPCNTSHQGVFNEVLPHAVQGDVTSKAASPNNTKLGTNYNFEKVELHTSIDSSLLSVPRTQSTPPPSSDFNIDLLQDILSMVMSPSSENAPSPSTQMRHLSLSGGQNDDDLEAGLELRQLLYGSCDSESTP